MFEKILYTFILFDLNSSTLIKINKGRGILRYPEHEKPKNDFEKKKELIGPGKYDYNECFSWIKKSFNVKYI